MSDEEAMNVEGAMSDEEAMNVEGAMSDEEEAMVGEGCPGDGRDDGTERYVHRPQGRPTPPEEREFGWRGWLLVVAIVVAFLVVPGLIYLNARDVLALPFRFAFLVLPLVPAVLLALLAVWATTTR